MYEIDIEFEAYAEFEVTYVDTDLATCGGAPSSARDNSGLLRMREASACLPASRKDLRDLIELGSPPAISLFESLVVHMVACLCGWEANPLLHRTSGNLLRDWRQTGLAANAQHALGVLDDDTDRAGEGRDSDRILKRKKTLNGKRLLIF
jgi:hypothetical protein